MPTARAAERKDQQAEQHLQEAAHDERPLSLDDLPQPSVRHDLEKCL